MTSDDITPEEISEFIAGVIANHVSRPGLHSRRALSGQHLQPRLSDGLTWPPSSAASPPSRVACGSSGSSIRYWPYLVDCSIPAHSAGFPTGRLSVLVASMEPCPRSTRGHRPDCAHGPESPCSVCRSVNRTNRPLLNCSRQITCQTRSR